MMHSGLFLKGNVDTVSLWNFQNQTRLGPSEAFKSLWWVAQVEIWCGTSGNMVGWHRWKYGMAQVEIWWICDNRVS